MLSLPLEPVNPESGQPVARTNRTNTDLRWVVLILICVLSAVYVFRFVDRGWIPHDDGSLAQMAERVLAGELPHRDFDEIYTGGLSFLYAAAFKVLGVKLVSIRIVLYLFFLTFVPALYSIALRFASPLVAGLVTLLGVVWSAPNYFAGLPSWYNLFFATFGTLALIRHIETGQFKWLFIAGLSGGLSFLAKVSGVYYIVAVFLFLTYREQVLSSSGTRPNFSSFFVLKVCFCLVFLLSLIKLLHSRLGPMESFHFLIPAVAICGILLWMEHKEGQGSFSGRCGRLSKLLIPFFLGVVIPIALFLIPYVVTNSVSAFYLGVFVLPQSRFEYAIFDFPPFITVVAALPYALILSFGFSTSRKPLFDTAIIATALALALISANHFHVYQVIWQSARSLAVVAVLTGCLVLARSFKSELTSPTKRQMLFLLLVMTGFVSFVQFPFPAPIYFCYIAPLVALTLLAIISLNRAAPRLLHLGALTFYFLFAVLWTNTGYVLDRDEQLLYRIGIGQSFSPYRPRSVLDLDRAGIRVPDADRDLYTRIVNLARTHQGSGYIYAAPDCPEIYFLSGLRNPTRNIFDFLTDAPKPTDLSALLQKKGVEFVAVNGHPIHSSRLDVRLVEALEELFPHSVTLDRFTLRWRE